MSFSELGITPALLTALAKENITEPMPIQTQALPLLLSGKNAYLHSQTGTGKTLAYLLPLFCRIDPALALPQAIVLAPTHELAAQIQAQAIRLATNSQLPIRSALIIGGASLARQLEKLKQKPHLIIGSPGRIRELGEMHKLKMHGVRCIVVDEADRLLSGISLGEVRAVVNSTLKQRQLVFVSATEQQPTSNAAAKLAPEMVVLHAGAPGTNADIEHFYLVCEDRDKPEMLRKLLHAMLPERAIVFVHRNARAEELAAKLAHHKLAVADLHAAADKHKREKAIADFRNAKVNLLIASDIAARGLDIKGVSHIFNLDAPSDARNYLHRVGRTARAGVKGYAISLLSDTETRLLRRYATIIGSKPQRICLREGQVQFLRESQSEASGCAGD